MDFEKKTYSNGWQRKKETPKSFKEKRGNLKPLMTEEEAVAKVEDLAYDFAGELWGTTYTYVAEQIKDPGQPLNL